MLCDYLYGEMMLEDLDIRMSAHLFDKTRLDFGTGIVGVVQNPEFRVSAFAVQVE